MAICKLNKLPALIGRDKRLMGLDVGNKTIGLAISDAALGVASPLMVIRRQKFTPDITEMLELAKARDVGGLVIGWPVNMDGSQGPRCDSTRDFAHALLRLQEIPIAFQDERLSTQAVESAMIKDDMTRLKRAGRRDGLAATWILQAALDRLRDRDAASGRPKS